MSVAVAMHRMEDAVLQPKKITYTDCVICFSLKWE